MQKRTALDKAMTRKYPEPVVLVTTRSPAGKANVMAVGWFATVSYEPLMFLLGIDSEALTCRLIKQTKQFVVAFPNEKMAREVLYAGTHHGHKLDKLAEAGLATQKASKVKAPLIADAVANFECTLAAVFRPGDCPLLVGKVVAAHENTNRAVKRLYIVGKNYKLGGLRPAR